MGGELENHCRWLELRGLRPNTVNQRRFAIQRITRQVGVPILEVTEADLKKWQAHLIGSPQTVCTYVSHLRGFYRWAVDEGLVPRDPSTRLIRPRIPSRLPRPIREVDLNTALRLAPLRIRPWLVLAGWAGLRACEIAPLRREQVHDDVPDPLVVVNGKGGKERVVPIGPRLLGELRPYLARPGFLFLRDNGQPGPITAHRVSQMSNEYLRSLGITDTFHSLRHRAASQLYAASHDISMTAAVLGHGNLVTTQGYVAYSQKNAIQAIRSVDRSLGESSWPAA